MNNLGNSNQYNDERKRDAYIEGNAVRKLQTAPQRITSPHEELEPKKRVSKKTHRNREKAVLINKRYIIFLMIISVLTLWVCIDYLKLRSTVTSQIKVVAGLETTLSNLRAENDALYDKTVSSINLEEVKKVAIEKLGMQYATKDQIIWYNTSGNSYFRQYQDISGGK